MVKKLLAMSIMAIIIGVTGCYEEQHNVLYKTEHLIAMRNYETIEGSFYLGAGSFGGKEYFIYYASNDDGSYSQRKVSTELVKIFEEDRSDGVAYWYVVKSLKTYLERIEFHIPYGSIQREFSLE